MLTAEMLDDWTAALRSGEYEQTSKFLKKDGKHCCLGVACEVWDLDIKNGYFELHRSGLDEDLMNAFITMNDNRQLSFSQIANYIEYNKEKILAESVKMTLLRYE
jgi:hypothetical protein